MKLKKPYIFLNLPAPARACLRLQFFLVLFFLGSFVFSVPAQSGRVKPSETPTPTSTPRARIVYYPTEKTLPVSTSTPKPTPAPDDDGGDVIKVESFLVPVPVSVLNANGQAVTNLKLEDFELLIDGQKAEISDIA
ncbi:MAG TPA: hypothetical protein VGC76_09470, partial [Pyrinomonadaceae bacterium]